MEAKMMKAWRLHDRGYDNIKFDTIPVPVPGPGDLLVKIGAVALNFRDRAVVNDFFDPVMLKDGPLILIGDCAGEIIQAGDDVIKFNTGDRVTTHLYSQWTDGEPRPDESSYLFGGPLPGGLAEFMIIPDYAAVKTPSYLSDEQACTLPVAGLTAWFALTNWGKIGKGDYVLVEGTGGVSLFGIQLANAFGAIVIATTSSEEKAEKAKSLGASYTINYIENPHWGDVALQLTGGSGVSQVLEVVGGTENLNQAIQATKVEGLITVIGFINGMNSNINLLPLILKQIRMQGMVVGHRAAFEAMNIFLEKHKIVPVIDTVYSFNNAPDAFQQLQEGSFGKIVISMNR